MCLLGDFDGLWLIGLRDEQVLEEEKEERSYTPLADCVDGLRLSDEVKVGPRFCAII